jgi:hypothetical protein
MSEHQDLSEADSGRDGGADTDVVSPDAPRATDTARTADTTQATDTAQVDDITDIANGARAAVEPARPAPRRRIGRMWLAGYLAFLGVVTVAGAPLFTLVQSNLQAIVGILIMVAVLGVLGAGANYLDKRSGSSGSKFLEQRFFAFNLLFGAVYLPGRIWFEHEVAWWLSAAVIAALPWLNGAYVVARQARSASGGDR